MKGNGRSPGFYLALGALWLLAGILQCMEKLPYTVKEARVPIATLFFAAALLFLIRAGIAVYQNRKK